MSNFFQGQMDYILFFYGLSFASLGIVCSFFARKVGQGLPWRWLACFGFAQGLYEWLNLFAFTWGEATWFVACRWIVMAASFLFLVEFGRRSLIHRHETGPGRWVLESLALLAAVGALAGFTCLQITTRYSLGLVGGLWAGWVLWTEARLADSGQRFWLRAGGVGLMLYGLTTGIAVAPSPIFPASTINNLSFANLTGVPIQVAGGLLGAWVAVMVMGYFQAAWPAANDAWQRFRARYLYGVTVALIIILVSGWILTQYLGGVAREQLLKDTASHANLIIQRLIFELEGADAAAKAMAGSPWIRPVLLAKTPETVAQANSVLDRYQSRFGACPAYVMDPTGTVIASSNRADPDSFVDHNYSFRPYFKKALAGHPGRYFALGVTSKKRGFYAAYPVRGPGGKVLGTVGIKTTLSDFQHEMQFKCPGFLVDPNGIIFLSNRPKLDYRSLWPVDRTDKALLKAQFGTADFAAIFPRPLQDGALVKLEGNNFVFYRQGIKSATAPGWSLVLLPSTETLIFYRLLGIAATLMIVVVLLIYAGNTLSVREGANHIRASESRFRALFDAAPEAVFVFDPKTRQIFGANPFMARWLGYDLEELVGLKIDEIRAAGDLEHDGKCAWHGAEGSNQSPGPRFRKKDGSLVDVECTTAQIFHGKNMREIVFVRDITERNKVAAELVWESMVNYAMADLSKSLLTSLPLVRIGALVYEHAVNLTGSKLGFCGHINPQTGSLVVAAMSGTVWEVCQEGEAQCTFPLQPGPWNWVLEHDQPFFANDPAQDPRLAGLLPEELAIQSLLSVPAMIENELVGQIVLANAERDYTLKDQELCERLALLYAQAIHRQRLDETLRESEKGLKTILDNVQTGILIVNPDNHVIVDVNPVAVAMIGLPKDQIVGSDCHKFVCSYGSDKYPMTDLHEPVNNSERILLGVDGSSRWIIKTEVPVSLKGRDYLLESFVDITERRQWEEAVQESNSKLQVLVAQVEEQNRIMTLINEMAELLQVCQASEEAYAAIEQFMPRFFPAGGGSIYMLNNSRNLFEAVASWGQTPPGVTVFAPEDCWSVRRGRLHKVDNPAEALLCRHMPPEGPKSYLCVPLIGQGETIGVLHLEWDPESEGQMINVAIPKEQLALAVAEDLALALANLRLRETLRSQAIRDPLTGLFNRRYMEETLEREIKRAKRNEASIGVIMMDLDHFKRYNDTYGHEAGDAILSKLGILVKGQIRGEDIACRYGGEEFLLIIPGASKEVAVERAELLRQSVKEMHAHYNGLKPITLSLGVAIYPAHGESGPELIRTADAALYQAKRSGRNQVILAPLPEEILRTTIPDPDQEDPFLGRH